MPFLPRVLVVLSLAGCGKPRVPIAPALDSASSEEVTFWTEELAGGRGETILARNNTSKNVMVVAVILQACENVALACGEHPVSKLLSPGESARLLVVRPKNGAKPEGFAYRFSYRWRFED